MKKICILFLVCSILFLPCAAVGEEEVIVHFSSLEGLKSSVSLACNTDWFCVDAHVYQHELCRLSLGMALAAFRGEAAAPDVAIRAFFSDLLFSPPSVEQFDQTSRDTIGTAISHRMINADGQSFPLIAIAVSGGNYGHEWLSNFDTGTGDIHQGFSSAAQTVLDRVQTYVEDHSLKNPRFWIAGYSRAAAVSNLTAALLEEMHLAPDEHIFAYTFATPRTIRGNHPDIHQNIFNIVHVADLVPHLPLSGWGYSLYGNSLYLPSSLSKNVNYSQLLLGYISAYEEITGLSPLYSDDHAFALLSTQIARGMYTIVSSPEKYVAAFQPIMEKLVLGEELNETEYALVSLLTINISRSIMDHSDEAKATKDFNQAIQSFSSLLPALMQHMPENYLSWLSSMEDGKLLFENSLTLTNGTLF